MIRTVLLSPQLGFWGYCKKVIKTESRFVDLPCVSKRRKAQPFIRFQLIVTMFRRTNQYVHLLLHP